MTTLNDTLITVNEAAIKLKSGPGAVMALIAEGRVRTVKMDDNKTVKVYASDIDLLQPSDVPKTGPMADALSEFAHRIVPARSRAKRMTTMADDRRDEFHDLVDLAIRKGYVRSEKHLSGEVGYSPTAFSKVSQGGELPLRMLLALYGYFYARELEAGLLSYTRRESDKPKIPDVVAEAVRLRVAGLMKKGDFDTAADLASWMASVGVNSSEEEG